MHMFYTGYRMLQTRHDRGMENSQSNCWKGKGSQEGRKPPLCCLRWRKIKENNIVEFAYANGEAIKRIAKTRMKIE